MLILVPSKIKVDKVLSLATKGSWLLILFVCVFYGAFSAISFYQNQRFLGQDLFRKKVPSQIRKLTLPLEKIGQGPLSLHVMGPGLSLPDLSQEIVLLSQDVRPDHSENEVGFLLLLRSSKSEQKVLNGQRVFLGCDSQPGALMPVYRFSQKNTPLWIRPVFLDESKVLVEVGLFTPSKSDVGFCEEKGQFVIREDSLETSARFQTQPWYSSLSKAKLWGVDVVLSSCKEETYKEYLDKLKLEIQGPKGPLFYFVQKGDYLVWNGLTWIPLDDCQEANGQPLAVVKNASLKEIELQVWNEEGFYPQSIRLEARVFPKSSLLSPEQIPQSVRARSSNQVSCCFAKQRYLLRPGDWILKTTRGWRVLKTVSDIEEYMQHRLLGELCVFDEMVNEKGKLVMKGYWVDKMRTQISQFSVPVEGKRAASAKTPKKEKKSMPMGQMNRKVSVYPPSNRNSKGDSHE